MKTRVRLAATALAAGFLWMVPGSATALCDEDVPLATWITEVDVPLADPEIADREVAFWMDIAARGPGHLAADQSVQLVWILTSEPNGPTLELGPFEWE